jgi:hypothetical protein
MTARLRVLDRTLHCSDAYARELGEVEIAGMRSPGFRI